jgi:hypothetical protein
MDSAGNWPPILQVILSMTLPGLTKHHLVALLPKWWPALESKSRDVPPSHSRTVWALHIMVFSGFNDKDSEKQC